MIFVVQFLRDVSRGSGPRIVRSVEFEADELFSVVSRVRIILACTNFHPVVEAFRILIDGTRVVHQERRGSVDGSGTPPAIGHQDRTITSTTSPS